MLNNTKRIKEIYKEIQKRIFYAIPGKWDELYLYASIIDRFGKVLKNVKAIQDYSMEHKRDEENKKEILLTCEYLKKRLNED